ncbi:uncharacterized protein LOC128551575 [Mercenaria mercenaria]|uniref:uncharacterized protein LOC128551575 n=1 Tax=Mercenaria mercenaria TaxID=6596 RepID=UPI00234ED1FD|nr:uncharacterized protein LOC128551575 [Mercenaria mercenaria]
MNKIKQNNKRLDLAYLELLNIWYSMMGSEASLEHIESALKRLDNKVIMEEFERIKDNPPTRKIFAQKTETSLMPRRKNEQFPLAQRPLFVYAQHESTHEIAETHDLLSHTEDGHFVQLTNFSATSQTQTSQSFLSDPSRLVRQKVQQRSKEKYYDNDPYHKVRWRGSKNKKRSSRRKSKMKKKLKMAEEMRKLESENSSLKNENITLIKTILPFDKIRLSRQQYNTFVDYTVNKIMEHNHVSRKTVLSITYEAYTEIAETKNGGRYILYSGSPNLNLDKDQYDDLVFYVKFARTRVLNEIEELQGNGDTLFLFITYDGKSALELYQRQSRLKKRRNLLNSFEPDYCSCSSGSSSSETESSGVHDIETGEGLKSQIHTSSASSSMYDNRVNDFCVETYNLPAISENNKSLKNKHTVSTHQNESYSATIYSRRRRNEEIEENHDCNDNEDITVVKGLPESGGFEVENEMSAECIPVEENRNQAMSEPLRTRNRNIANHNNGVQENDSDMSFEDLMEDIDKELACTTSL